MPIRNCKACFIEFETEHPQKIFCDNRCKSRWHDERRDRPYSTRRAREAEQRYARGVRRVGDTYIVLCMECGTEYAFLAQVGRRPGLCSPLCKSRRRRRGELADRYGITLEEYELLWEKQNGLCAICSGSLIRRQDKFAAVDHCHTSGRVRGLLCFRCNLALGQFQDSAEVLRAALRYLAAPIPELRREIA